MPKVQERAGEIIFLEKVPNGLRVFLSIVGLFPIFITPYELLIRPNWQGFSINLLISIIVSIGAFLLGGFFLAAGLWGLNQTLIFTQKSKSVQYYYESALMPLRKKTYPFKDIEKISINRHDWSDGPSTYSLQVVFQDGQKIETGSFEKISEAEQYLNKVEKLAITEEEVGD